MEELIIEKEILENKIKHLIKDFTNKYGGCDFSAISLVKIYTDDSGKRHSTQQGAVNVSITIK